MFRPRFMQPNDWCAFFPSSPLATVLFLPVIKHRGHVTCLLPDIAPSCHRPFQVRAVAAAVSRLPTARPAMRITSAASAMYTAVREARRARESLCFATTRSHCMLALRALNCFEFFFNLGFFLFFLTRPLRTRRGDVPPHRSPHVCRPSDGACICPGDVPPRTP